VNARSLIPRLTDIIEAIGNVLRHSYESIAPPVIWKLVQADLPALEKTCRTELAAEEDRQHR
jgi:uncharacterized protein with HEPN domain